MGGLTSLGVGVRVGEEMVYTNKSSFSPGLVTIEERENGVVSKKCNINRHKISLKRTITLIPFLNTRVPRKMHFKDFGSSSETCGQTSRIKHVHPKTLGLIGNQGLLGTN